MYSPYKIYMILECLHKMLLQPTDIISCENLDREDNFFIIPKIEGHVINNVCLVKKVMNIYFPYGSYDFFSSDVERISFINYYRGFQFLGVTNCFSQVDIGTHKNTKEMPLEN